MSDALEELETAEENDEVKTGELASAFGEIFGDLAKAGYTCSGILTFTDKEGNSFSVDPSAGAAPDYEDMISTPTDIPTASEAPPGPAVPELDSEGDPIVPGDPEAEVNDESVDYSDWTVEDLKDETDKKGLKVERSDGKSGEPLKDDYIEALTSGSEEE